MSFFFLRQQSWRKGAITERSRDTVGMAKDRPTKTPRATKRQSDKPLTNQFPQEEQRELLMLGNQPPYSESLGSSRLEGPKPNHQQTAKRGP